MSHPCNTARCEAAYRLAIFDFDGTLCAINSWHIFLKWLLSECRISSARVALTLAARGAGIVSSAALKNVALGRLHRMPRSEVDAVGIRLYQRSIRPRLLPDAINALKQRQERGYRVLVASGAFDFLLQPFCAEYGIREWIATQPAYDGDFCLGRLDGLETRGIEKRRRLLEYLAGQPVAWLDSVAYSDELSDLPLLTLVGTGYLVGNKIGEPVALPAGIRRGSW